MKAIDTETGEVIADGLTESEVEKLIDAGADFEAEEVDLSQAQGGSSSGEQTVDGIAERDDEPERRGGEVSKVDEHSDSETQANRHDDYDQHAMPDVEEAVGEVTQTDPDEDVETAGLDMERRFERIQREMRRENTDLAEDKEARDQRIEEMQAKHGDDADDGTIVMHEAVREYLRETGQAEEIVEAFEKFKSEDRWVAGDDGDRLNEDAVVDMIAGDTSAQDRLYERKLKSEPGDRVIGVASDMSGSMSGAVKYAKAAIGALALAADTIGDDFVANSWCTVNADFGGNAGDKQLNLITGPDEEFEWEQLDGMTCNDLDPISSGMRHIKEQMEQVSASEQVMVVLTDGQPQVTTDITRNATEAVREAREHVERYRQEGYVVIGLGIEPGVDEDLMEEMFGERGYTLTTDENIAENLAAIYESQMNVQGGER